MWVEKYSRTDSPVVVFYCSRFWRVLPIFWLTNLLSAVVQRAIDPRFLGTGVPGWGWLPALASNILVFGYADLPHTQGALHAAWSLDVEMQFYLAFPVAFFLIARPRASRAWQSALVAACCVGLILFLVQSGPIARNLGYYGIFFLIGFACAHRNLAPSATLAAALAGAGSVVIALCWFNPAWRFLLENAMHGATAGDIHHKRIAQALLALASAPLALFTVRNPSDAFDRRVGELTYVVYLVQWPIMTLHAYFFVHLPPLERLPSIIVAWCVVGAASWAIFRYFDQPIERRRKRWVAAHSAA